MNKHFAILGLVVSTALVGCAASDAPADEHDEVADEALSSAPPPALSVRGNDVQVSGLPALFGLAPSADGSKIREIVFVETSTPDGPDLDGRTRFPEIRYHKLIAVSLPTGVEVTIPDGGVADGAMLISGDNGKVREPVVASADREVKKLWDQHADGRFTIRLFPSSGGSVVRTANGFTATINANGALVATDGHGTSYSANADLATEEDSIITVGGDDAKGSCKYRVSLKEAAVLSAIANVAVFHVERTLTSKTGSIACTKHEDRFVLGTSAH